MSSDQDKKLAKFSTLIEIASTINASLDPDDVLPTILNLAQRAMDAFGASVALIDEATQELVYVVATSTYGDRVKQSVRLKMGQGIAGWVAQHGQKLVLTDVANDPRFDRASAQRTGYMPRSMVCVPMRAQGKIIGILQTIDPQNKVVFDEHDGEFFEAFASLAATALNNARLHKAILKQQSEQQERDFASQIQQSFLPRQMPDIPRISIAGHNEPAREVSGDFYDVIRLSPTKVALIVGDVTGKGVASSLYMVRCLFETRRMASITSSPAALLTAKNQALNCESSEKLAAEMASGKPPHPPIFLGMLFVTFDAATGELCYANAGMPDPILHSARGTELLSNSGGPALGMLPGMDFTEGVKTLTGGETLVLFTDGLSEARNLGGVEFGYDRIREALDPPPTDAIAAEKSIATRVSHFVGSAEHHDDLTFLTFHFAAR